MKKKFSGPVFIIGMSRSGTKLLRDILNNGGEVAIPEYESHFIPYLLEKFPPDVFPLSPTNKSHLEKLIKSSIFYNEIKKESGGQFVDVNFDELLRKKNIRHIIKELIAKLARPTTISEPNVWGDKTPNYLTRISFLKQAFPSAKFIHIIRDPRERALSTKKAWNTSIEMSALRWKQGVSVAQRQGKVIGDDYYEIKYEDLIEDPESKIKETCDFLGVAFAKRMLQLNKSAERYNTAGNNTKNAKTIVSNNSSKFRENLSRSDIIRIESICGDLARKNGYELCFIKGRDKETTDIKFRYLILRDKVMAVKFHISNWGYVRGINYLLWRRKVTRDDSERQV